MACGYGKDSTQNAEFLNLTPQTYTAPLSTWFPPKTLWLREGPKGGGAVPILASYHTQRTGGGGGGGAGCEEAFHLIFHCPPLVCALPEKPGPKACGFFKLQLLLISWAVVACFLHWKVAGQMLPMGPQLLPITFPLATLGFYEWGFNMLIKRRISYGNFLEFMVCEGLRKPCKGQEPSYTGACRHPQNLGFMSISKLGNPCFHVDRHGMSP